MGHHYLPQRYLLHFSHQKRIWVFDRQNKRSFQSAPKSVANESDMYSAEVEAFLNKEVEMPTHSVFDKIIKRDRISESDRGALARYITYMWKRVPRGRKRALERIPKTADETLRDLIAQIDECVRRGLMDEVRAATRRLQVEEIINQQKLSPSPSLWYDGFTPIGGSRVVEALLTMNWTFLYSDGHPFLTSDNPVFFFEHEGIGRPTSELTFPISDSIALFADRKRIAGNPFVSAKDSVVKMINARTVSNSDRFVFAKHNQPWMLPFINKGGWKVSRLSGILNNPLR